MRLKNLYSLRSDRHVGRSFCISCIVRKKKRSRANDEILVDKSGAGQISLRVPLRRYVFLMRGNFAFSLEI